MLFPEADAPLLKAWIVKRLENTSDADPDVLADYVLALLHHEGDENSIRKLCEAEIPDFLKEDAADFVDDVFRAVEYKSYIPGAPPPPKTERATLPTQLIPAMNYYPVPASPSGSKKRSFVDYDMPAAMEGPFTGQRAYKQPRRGRGGRGSRLDNFKGRAVGLGHGHVPFASPPMDTGGPHLPSLIPNGLSGFDPGSPMEAIMKLQAMGLPLPNLGDFAHRGSYGRPQYIGRRRQRCRDFDTKGYCTRAGCMFDHGSEPIFIPGSMQISNEEYDPNNAGIMMPGPVRSPPVISPTFSSGRSQNGHKKRHQGEGRKKRQDRTALSADGPVHDRTKTTIVVENIPEENFFEDQVRVFFDQFGEIKDISMQPYKHLAIVKYNSWNAANAAYRSPKVIFDNRFVKVFWYKDNADAMATSISPNGANGTKDEDGGTSISQEDSTMSQEFDMEEFLRKQEAAQKLFDEKMQKKQEVQRQRQELEKRQQDLLARQHEEREKLRAKLAVAGRDDGNADSIATSNSGLDVKMGDASVTDKLRAQLAALEEEAKSLGLDPNAVEESGPWAFRGRGRGRGSYRGRHGSRGFRGGYRGGYHSGREDVHAAYAAYSLDNRPKRVLITGIDFTEREKDEMLRQYLLGVGDFTDLETTSAATTVTFADRKTAEKFYYGLAGREIPGIDGKIELAWAPSATSVPVSTVGNGAAKGLGLKNHLPARPDFLFPDMGDQEIDQPTDQATDQAMDQSEMDYDIAEEADWEL